MPSNCPDIPQAPRLPPALNEEQARVAYEALLAMNLPSVSCNPDHPGTCIFHMALERPYLLEIFAVEGFMRATYQIASRTDARDNLEMSVEVSSDEEDGHGSADEGERKEAEEKDAVPDMDGSSSSSSLYSYYSDAEIVAGADAGPSVVAAVSASANADADSGRGAAASAEVLQPQVVDGSGHESGAGPNNHENAKRAKRTPRETAAQALRVNLRGPIPAEMLTVGEWLVRHVRSGEGHEGPADEDAYSEDWVAETIRRGERTRPTATKATTLCYAIFSMLSKFRDFADTLYAGCCRWHRGEHEMLSAFRTCLETTIRDVDSFSVNETTALLTFTWTCDDLLEMYDVVTDPRVFISYKLLSIEQQDQRPVDKPGIPWPIHPMNARYPDRLLDADRMVGMSQIEIDALPINGHRGDVMQATG